MALVPIQDRALNNQGGTTQSTYADTWTQNPKIGSKVEYKVIVDAYPGATGQVNVSATDNAAVGNTWTVAAQAFNSGNLQSIVHLYADIASLPASGQLTVTLAYKRAGVAISCYSMIVATEWPGGAPGALLPGADSANATLSSNTVTGTSIAVGPTGTLAQPASLATMSFTCDSGTTSTGLSIPGGTTLLGGSINQDDSASIAYGACYQVLSSTSPLTLSFGASTNVSGTWDSGVISIYKIAPQPFYRTPMPPQQSMGTPAWLLQPRQFAPASTPAPAQRPFIAPLQPPPPSPPTLAALLRPPPGVQVAATPGPPYPPYVAPQMAPTTSPTPAALLRVPVWQTPSPPAPPPPPYRAPLMPLPPLPPVPAGPPAWFTPNGAAPPPPPAPFQPLPMPPVTPPWPAVFLQPPAWFTPSPPAPPPAPYVPPLLPPFPLAWPAALLASPQARVSSSPVPPPPAPYVGPLLPASGAPWPAALMTLRALVVQAPPPAPWIPPFLPPAPPPWASERFARLAQRTVSPPPPAPIFPRPPILMPPPPPPWQAALYIQSQLVRIAPLIPPQPFWPPNSYLAALFAAIQMALPPYYIFKPPAPRTGHVILFATGTFQVPANTGFFVSATAGGGTPNGVAGQQVLQRQLTGAKAGDILSVTMDVGGNVTISDGSTLLLSLYAGGANKKSAWQATLGQSSGIAGFGSGVDSGPAFPPLVVFYWSTS